MNRSQRVRYETLVRVSEFGTAHPALFAEGTAAAARLTVVAAAVAEVEKQSTDRLRKRNDGETPKAVAGTALRRMLAAVSKTARIAARQTPGVDDVFKGRDTRADIALLAHARAFLQEAEASREALTSLGVTDAYLAEFRTRLANFEQATVRRRVGRSSTAAANAQLNAALDRGMEAVRQLDVIITNAHLDDAEVLKTWGQARRVTTKGTGASSNVSAPAAEPASASTPNAVATEAGREPLPKAS